MENLEYFEKLTETGKTKGKALSPRLLTVLDCISAVYASYDTEYLHIADIGTDHAYLPIEAVRRICYSAVACDIKKGPLEAAKKNIAAAELELRIETRLGNGLQPLAPGEADCIVIAGMGGRRIMDILTDGFDKLEDARLVLQPQHDAEKVRRYLHRKGYEIVTEKLAREHDRFYVIIGAKPGADWGVEPWSAKEYFVGDLDFRCPHTIPYLRQRRKQMLEYIDSITDKRQLAAAKKKFEWLGCGVKELEEFPEEPPNDSSNK